MAIVEWKKAGTCAIVSMNNAENAHNLEFAKALNQAIDAVVEDKSVTSLILTSTDGKHFSTGVDVVWLLTQQAEGNIQNIKNFMYTMNDVFKKLLLIPIPTIAAINGHAFGNGSVLCCACDFRFMKSDRGYFCFPEVDLGIPFLPSMLAYIKKSIPYYKFNELCLSGRKVGAAELEVSHVIEKACVDENDLMKEALAFAQTFTKKRGIFGEHKKRLHKHIFEIMETEDPEFIEPINLMVQD